MKNIIFLDIDGVLNHELFFKSWNQEGEQLDVTRIALLNQLCIDANCDIVISSTWRMSGLDDCIAKLKEYGATFNIIGATPILRFEGIVRGCEIALWLEKNITEDKYGCRYYDFYKYVILDDDSDMLLNQHSHFFHVDAYAGLTPNICYKINRFLTHKTF